jgi:hypothetical protein
MTKKFTILMVCVGALLPAAAWADQSDAAYCAALGKKYEQYVGDNAASHRGQQRDATVATAISKCDTDAANSIPVIEQALKNAKVDLPPRG